MNIYGKLPIMVVITIQNTEYKYNYIGQYQRNNS